MPTRKEKARRAELTRALKSPAWPERIPLGASGAMETAAADLARAWGQIDAAEGLAADLAEARAALAELLADYLTPESGNPWRLDSVKAASRILTGDSMGFSAAGVMAERLKRGTLGGRFKAPYLGAAFEALGRAAADLAEAERAARGARQLAERARAAADLGQPWAPDLAELDREAARKGAEAERARAAHAAALAELQEGGPEQ